MPEENGSGSTTGSSQEGKGKRYALVVGVNKSTQVRGLSALRYAESDAESIGYLLKRKECNFSLSRPILIGEAASTQNVREAINFLINSKSENDLLLFYFIGHGYPVEISDGKYKVYLVTTDFDPGQARLNPNMYLSLDEIREILYERQNTVNTISILDCCHAGYITESPSLEKRLAQLLDAFVKNFREIEQPFASSHRTWAILASTRIGDNAYEGINKLGEGHALMTGLILDALSGNARDALDERGDLTLEKLHVYLQRQMEGQRQHPIMQGTFQNLRILAHHPSANPELRKPEDYPPSPFQQPFDMDLSSATFDDLDFEQIRTFLKKERVQLQLDYQAGPNEQAQMQALSLLQGKHPNYGTLLCFRRNLSGYDPSRQITGAYTRCIYWSDTKRLSGWIDEKEYRGSLLEQFTQACDFLRNHLKIDPDGNSEQPEIPFRVLEEALANALIHREYVTEPDRVVQTAGVRVEIFSNRVEIQNPGKPLTTVNTEHPESYPRNSQIMRIFYLAGHAETVGTGIIRMRDLMQKAGLPQPDIKTNERTFTIVLSRPTQSPVPPVDIDTPAQPPLRSRSNKSEQVPVTPSHRINSQPIADNDGRRRKSSKLLVLTEFLSLFIVGGILALVTGIFQLVPIQPLGPASTTIEIASDFPTSGLELGGLPLQHGVQMALTEANHEHLLPGHTFKLVSYDDVGNGNRHDPQIGAHNLQKAIDENLVAGVIGPADSSVALKELPLANQAPLALLSPRVTFPCLTKNTAYDPNCIGTNDVATQMHPPTSHLTFFRLATTDDRQGKTAADYFFQTKHYSKVLLLRDDNDTYSLGLTQAFQIEWQHMGGLVISIDLPQNASNEQNYQDTLQAASSSAPDLIYFAGSTPNSSYILQALSNIATLKTVPFAGGDGMMDNSLLQQAADLHRDAPIYVSLPSEDPAHSETATGANFERNYKANGYQDYVPDAAAAYDCTKMLIQAIKAALQKGVSTPYGMQDRAGAVKFRQAVLQALSHLSYTGATGKHSFDANGDTTNHTVSFYEADLSTPQPSWKWLEQVDG